MDSLTQRPVGLTHEHRLKHQASLVILRPPSGKFIGCVEPERYRPQRLSQQGAVQWPLSI